MRLLTAASAGLTKALLRAMLNVDSFAAVATSFSGPREVPDTVAATVLGVTGLLVVLPAALGYVFIQLARCAVLMILATTSAISAAGLTSERGRAWFWESLRWFISASLISPLAALVLGIGVKISEGVVAGSGDKNAAAVGMALVSCMLILIGAAFPLIVFRMLAFVDPGTSSGAAVRTSFAASGGVAALMGGKGGGDDAGGSAGTRQDGDGRSMGESDADSQTQGRFAQSMNRLSGGLTTAGNTMAAGVSGSSAIGADVLGAAGVGHQAPYFGQADTSMGSDSGSPDGSSGGGEPRSSRVPPSGRAQRWRPQAVTDADATADAAAPGSTADWWILRLAGRRRRCRREQIGGRRCRRGCERGRSDPGCARLIRPVVSDHVFDLLERDLPGGLLRSHVDEPEARHHFKAPS